ncbi:MAG: cyclic nucleotide-binding domain-containing protein [Proteobacteria bacterium]|nr:cyclic nucleotide-binding domain-containing protein [Desulfobacterales bacterium]MBL7173897.1 cyclic nucleotide-binding domain-containing protein [Desulfobacteraceae bacterium]MBU0733188.1 cyclic nucleotide-binding domain-containing protein [Pseudomonadota bacterium]MBU0989101.1 cyclic nucleotide-binding domain-containing protein [Pseudomonadota bacterium]MBU1902576.1 cyclic nucleotide-binding domain-containing protein [Pseudomonadota bacterium]
MDRSELGHAIKSCEFFKGIESSLLEKIVDLCQVQTYEPGEYVFSQGDFGEHLYIIAHGNIFLERSMDLGTRKGSAVIGVLGKGRVLGCWSTLLGEPHNLMSSAICQKPTRVVVIKGADLREMMVSNTELGFRLLERLCFLLRDRIQGALGAMEKI